MTVDYMRVHTNHTRDTYHTHRKDHAVGYTYFLRIERDLKSCEMLVGKFIFATKYVAVRWALFT